MTPWEILLLVVWVSWAFGGYEIGKHKGLPRPGLILALVVGVIGIRVIARVPQIRRPRSRHRDDTTRYSRGCGGAPGLPGSRNRASGSTNPTDLLEETHNEVVQINRSTIVAAWVDIDWGDQAVHHLRLQYHNGNNDRVVRRIRQHTAGFRHSAAARLHALRSVDPPAFQAISSEHNSIRICPIHYSGPSNASCHPPHSKNRGTADA